MATIGSLSASLSLESAAFISGLNKASGAMQKSAASMEKQSSTIERGFAGVTKAAGALRTGLLAIGAAVSVTGLVHLAKAAIDTGDHLRDVAQRVGVTVEQLQGLEFAAQRTGSSASGMDNALEAFSKRLGEAAAGTGELKTFLEANNIALRESDGSFKSTSALLSEYADLTANAGSAQEKAALAAAAFGRTAGAELIPLLSEGAAGIQAYVAEAEKLGVVSTAQAAAASDANDAMDNLNQAVGAASQSLLIAAAPAFQAVAEGLVSMIMAFKALDPETQKLIGIAAAVAAAFTALAPVLGIVALGVAALASPIALVVAGIIGAGGAIAAIVAFREEIGGAALSAINGLTEAFVSMKDGAIAAVSDMVAGIKAALGQGLQSALAAATAPIAAVTDAFKGMYDAVVGRSYVPDMVDRIEVEFKRLRAIMVDPTKTAASDVSKEFAKLETDLAHLKVAVAEPPASTFGADQQADILAEPFKNALREVQNSFTDTFREIFEGGVTSFEDIAEQAKKIFIDLAANLATTGIFNPQSLSGLFGFASQSGGAAGATTGAAPSLASQLGGFAGSAGLGFAGGTFAGGLINRGQSQLGGGIGGALGAGAGFAFGGPLGAALGGAGGSLLGSAIGSLFGGGEKRARFSGSGGLGQVSGGEIGSFIRSIDQGIQDILNIQAAGRRRRRAASLVGLGAGQGLRPERPGVCCIAACRGRCTGARLQRERHHRQRPGGGPDPAPEPANRARAAAHHRGSHPLGDDIRSPVPGSRGPVRRHHGEGQAVRRSRSRAWPRHRPRRRPTCRSNRTRRSQHC